jgi:hypothetical protein
MQEHSETTWRQGRAHEPAKTMDDSRGGWMKLRGRVGVERGRGMQPSAPRRPAAMRRLSAHPQQAQQVPEGSDCEGRALPRERAHLGETHKVVARDQEPPPPKDDVAGGVIDRQVSSTDDAAVFLVRGYWYLRAAPFHVSGWFHICTSACFALVPGHATDSQRDHWFITNKAEGEPIESFQGF